MKKYARKCVLLPLRDLREICKIAIKKTASHLTRWIFIQLTWNFKQSFLVKIYDASRERFAIFYFSAEIFDVKLRRYPPKKSAKNENRYKTINNELNRKSSLDDSYILAKNLCLKFQVDRMKIDRVRRDAVFCPGEPRFCPGGPNFYPGEFFFHIFLSWPSSDHLQKKLAQKSQNWRKSLRWGGYLLKSKIRHKFPIKSKIRHKFPIKEVPPPSMMKFLHFKNYFYRIAEEIIFSTIGQMSRNFEYLSSYNSKLPAKNAQKCAEMLKYVLKTRVNDCFKR